MRHWLVFLLVFTCSPVFAWELLPEYLGLNEKEQQEFDNPRQTDSEYQSDILAFSRSFGDDYDFYSSPQVIVIGMGSIGSKDFFIQDVLKVESPLTDSLKMRFHYLREEDWDRETEAAILELEQMFSEKWGVAIFGEAMHRKAEIDFSTALVFKPSEEHTIRAFYSFVDVSRNERNELADRFETAPRTYGLVGRWIRSPESGEKEFFNYSIRHEKPTRWLFPDEEYRYLYERKSASIYTRWRFLNHHFGLRWEGEEKLEEKQKSSALSPFADEARWERTKHIIQLEVERPLRAIAEAKIRLGVVGAVREFDTSNGSATQSQQLPYLWFRAPAGQTAGIQDFYQVGLDTTLFRETGNEVLVGRPTGELKEEYRLNTSYDFFLMNQAQLRLIFTFDLDRFGSGETWEGGAGTFQMSF